MHGEPRVDDRAGAGRVALVREVGAAIAEGERTHVERVPIDVERARAQHAAYVATLAELGCEVVRLPAAAEWPDAVFVEDTVVVLDEVAVAARPGAPSRRAEVPSVVEAVRADRPVMEIAAPGTLDGGDVLVAGRTLFVGRSGRTNDEGVEQMERIGRAHGYEVRPVDFRGCLHLKSAATCLDDQTLLVHRPWVDVEALSGLELIDVDPAEPGAANALAVGGVVLVAERFPRTAERLAGTGYEVRTLAADELARAEGGLTCCSVIYRR